MNYYDTMALTLLYVLSAIATFWFLCDRARWLGMRSYKRYAALGALLWPLVFVYAMVIGFPRK